MPALSSTPVILMKQRSRPWSRLPTMGILITPPPTNDEQQEPEIESDEPASYRVEIDRCPLYLSIEAKSGTSAIQKAIDLVRLVTKNETEGLRLPLGEPGDHDADAIIYPSFDAKDYGIADIEPMV